MDEFFKWLSANQLATNVLIITFLIVVIVIAIIYIVGFYQGRDISIWPPKLGPKPEKTQKEDVPVTKPITFDNQLIPPVKSVQYEQKPRLSQSTKGIVKLPKNSILILSDSLQLDLDATIVEGVIAQTPYSLIEKCSIQEQPFILKRTEKRLCDIQALTELVQNPLSTHYHITCVTPVAIWITDDYVWELLPYYDGIPIYKLLRKNKYKLSGVFLGEAYNGLFESANEIHGLGILHRDINPTNVLLTRQGNLAVLDFSFSCKQNSKQLPVANDKFCSPEQILGKAIVQSDWYSIAATICFMASGEPPKLDAPQYLESQLSKIFTGNYVYSPEKIIKELLNPDISQRPSKLYEILLDPGSYPMDPAIVGVLDITPYGYLVLERFSYFTMSHEDLVSTLSRDTNRFSNPTLRNDAIRFLNGENPWLR